MLTLLSVYIPPSFEHYVENTGNTTMKYLGIFNTDVYEDISLNQWLALTPPDMVKVSVCYPLARWEFSHGGGMNRLTYNSTMRPSLSSRR